MTGAEARPRVVIIVAMAKNRVIGKDNKLPWHLSEDLRRFKALTMGHPIVMGRKTFESIGRPLPGRRNIVVSRNPKLSIDGAEIAASLEDAIGRCAGAQAVFVIGGEQIYRQALPLTDRIELTEVDCLPEGDALFPPLDDSEWRALRAEPHESAANGFAYRFLTLERRRPLQAAR